MAESDSYPVLSVCIANWNCRENFCALSIEAYEFGVDDIELSVRLDPLGKKYYLSEAQVIHWGGVATELDEPMLIVAMNVLMFISAKAL